MGILAAQKLSIEGRISNFEKKPIENATVYLLKQKDSSIINYTASNKEGKFSLKTGKVNEPTLLKIDAKKLISYSKNFDTIDQSISLGEIELERNAVFSIEEVRIKVSPIKIKKDTIEFNASSLKVRPDSKIEELLKQIPGVEISNDQKITVNGKEVDQIMINGKPFFNKDGKIALQNLPADIIKNIQFTTTKTKEEELSGKVAKSNKATINFTIDEKKNKGLISRLTLGYGSDKRYEGNTFLSYFKNDTRISVVASSNNINSDGFSSDQVFDSMRNNRGSQTTQGLQKSSTIGINYNDKFGKGADLDNLSFLQTKNNLETQSKVSRTTLLPDFTLKTNSESKGENETQQYNFNISTRIQLDSLTDVYFSPSFSQSKGFNFNNSTSSTFKDNALLNESDSYSNSDSENNSFSPNIYISKRFKKEGRVANLGINTSISESKNNDLNRSETRFFQSNDPNDSRNQLAENKSQNSDYSFTAGYTEPISDSVSLTANLRYQAKLSSDFKEVNDFDVTTGQYSNYNSILSNSLDQKINQIMPELSLSVNKKKFNIWLSLSLDISDMKMSSIFNQQQYDLQKSFFLPNYNASLQYAFSESKRLTLTNYSSFTTPSAGQLIPYLDLSNPLVSTQGNPDLKSTWTNKAAIYFSNFNLIRNLNYYVNIDFNYINNDISNYSYYDASGKQFITYANVSGNKSITAGGNIAKTYKWKKNKFTINPVFNMTYDYKRGFINDEKFTSNSYIMNPAINLTYEVPEKFTIKPSYSIGYNFSNYTNYSIDKVQTTNQSLKVEITNYVLKSNLVFGNDFVYNTSSNFTPGFKRDYYFWNTSLGYAFFDKQLIAKVKIYDVLNQNQSIKRTITNSYFEDREDLILKRYIMFSLTMKLNKFAGKKL